MAKLILYEVDQFQGRSLPLSEATSNFLPLGFDNKSSSIEVESGVWTVYEAVNYGGRSLILRAGKYDIDYIINNLGSDVISSARPAEITLYGAANFTGKVLKLYDDTQSLIPLDFNNIVSSIEVTFGEWSVYNQVDYQGARLDLNVGKYNIDYIANNIGNDVISSLGLRKMPTLILYDTGRFQGKTLSLTEATSDLIPLGFDKKASSIEVKSGVWTVYDAVNYGGFRLTLGVGKYDSKFISEKIGSNVISSARPAEITLYGAANFQGKCLKLYDDTQSLISLGFNNIVSAIEVTFGEWSVYNQVDYQGARRDLNVGKYNIDFMYNTLGNDVISSLGLRKTPKVILYDRGTFQGRSLPLSEATSDLIPLGFDNKASSIEVESGVWTVYEDINYEGYRLTLGVGKYDFGFISDKIGSDVISSAKPAEITLYDAAGFRGKSLKLYEDTQSFIPLGFNNVVSTIEVTFGEWLVYDQVDYKGKSLTLKVGKYNMDYLHHNLGNDVVSSVKPIASA